MAFIQNCAASDITTGMFYQNPGQNSMVIQIVDPGGWKPTPKHNFKEVHCFEFLDIEKDDIVFDEECRVSDLQAALLVGLLAYAFEHNMNVIVHCTAGICRSGAVCEVGVMMGFEDLKKYRQPNLLVKHKMMKVLGMTYDEDEVSEPINLSNPAWEGDI